MYTSFEDVTIDDGVESINFCEAEEDDVTTIYLVDTDGSLRGGATSSSGPSVLLGRDPVMTTMFDSSVCNDVPEGCYMYCPGVCFRSYRYDLARTGTEGYNLLACKDGDLASCASFPWSQRGSNDPRTFIAPSACR